ncbi:MAG: UDP-3-O-(3-hydroxymyristoyl)glucosamine N-acyltransferase [Planctomycetota bacterium]|nr:UDP-3-O-(3-hydroxymyristoyl)glucosamine N-acyltransferase [Planctomycetota bacterium]
MTITIHDLAERLGATLKGDGDKIVVGCAPIDTAGPEHITFLANVKYVKYLQTTKAGAVLIGSNVTCPEELTSLVCEDPYFAFRNAMVELHGYRKHAEPVGDHHEGISERAMVHSEATIGPGAIIHPFVTIEAGASVGSNSVLYPGVYIGRDAKVGDDCLLYPNVVIYERCILGDRVMLHGNTVIGSDGFGYATHDGAHHKIPQNGIVVIEDDVELGVGCAIERGAMDETRIGQGTKFADLISIGHGTTIGKHCLIVSLCGVSGSVQMGDYVVLGGQVGVTGHLKIGNFVQAMGHSGITSDIPDGLKVGGEPAIPYIKAKRNYIAQTELYELVKRVRKLERELKDLKSSDQS